MNDSARRCAERVFRQHLHCCRWSCFVLLFAEDESSGETKLDDTCRFSFRSSFRLFSTIGSPQTTCPGRGMPDVLPTSSSWPGISMILLLMSETSFFAQTKSSESQLNTSLSWGIVVLSDRGAIRKLRNGVWLMQSELSMNPTMTQTVSVSSNSSGLISFKKCVDSMMCGVLFCTVRRVKWIEKPKFLGTDAQTYFWAFFVR